MPVTKPPQLVPPEEGQAFPVVSLCRASARTLRDARALVVGFRRDPDLGAFFRSEEDVEKCFDVYTDLVFAVSSMIRHAVSITKSEAPQLDVAPLVTCRDALEQVVVCMQAIHQAVCASRVLDDGDARMVRTTAIDTWAIEADDALEQAVAALDLIVAAGRLRTRLDLN